MNVLRKIGITTFLLIGTLSASNISAQEKCETEVKKTSVKKDPIDFVQNYLLNPKAQQANLENTAPKTNQKDLLASRTIKKEPSKTESYTTSMLNWIQEKYSSMIDVLPDQISNVMLYRFIDEWYGVRYRMGGTSKKGVDCSAFVQNLYQYVFWGEYFKNCWVCNIIHHNTLKNPADLKEGDLVFF
jgi:cell wall-associated NlpC family hydrolase